MMHTPGPWEYSPSGEVPFNKNGKIVKESYPATVRKIDKTEEGLSRTAFVCECNSTTLPNDANARLIAASPKLLDACETALKALENAYPREDHRALFSLAYERLTKAIAAASEVPA